MAATPTPTKIRVAINGFGRIGRNFFKIAQEYPDVIEVVAVNDIASIDNIVYLLKYDSVYGRSPFSVEKKSDTSFVAAGREVAYVSEKDPAMTSATILMGINEELFSTSPVTSNASCTTNGASPLIVILDEAIGIEKAILNTTHAYTASQALVDAPARKDIREGRAAALNIVPASTGAAIAVTKAYTKLAGKFDGISLRVPVPAGSIADVTFISKRPTTADEVNDILRKAAKDPRWAGIFAVTEDPLVSSDIVGNPNPSIAELSMTRVVDGNLVKVLAWYDNEGGYSHALVKHVVMAGGIAVK